jgi:hypothetical protein
VAFLVYYQNVKLSFLDDITRFLRGFFVSEGQSGSDQQFAFSSVLGSPLLPDMCSPLSTPVASLASLRSKLALGHANPQ